MDQESFVEEQNHDFCWHNIIGCCKKPKCTNDHVPNQKNFDNAWINNVCDVFHEPVIWMTNHDTAFPGAQAGGNWGHRGGNGVNSVNVGVCGINEPYGGKNNKKIL